jgi:hypothetical protein
MGGGGQLGLAVFCLSMLSIESLTAGISIVPL